jgi:predicted nucleotidyltransferase
VPEATYHSIEETVNRQTGFPDFDHLTPYLHSALITKQNPENYLDFDRDLANRLSQLPWSTMTFTEIADQLKSRNFTHSRIHRALLHLILGIKNEDFHNQFKRNPIPYARILGFRRESSLLIKEIGKKGSFPLITKPASIHSFLSPTDSWIWNMDLAASRLYQSIQFQHFGRILPSVYERTPIII